MWAVLSICACTRNNKSGVLSALAHPSPISPEMIRVAALYVCILFCSGLSDREGSSMSLAEPDPHATGEVLAPRG